MKPPPPYLGAAYYPEAWPESQIDRDIAQMQEVGITLVRVAEFAWSRMEPAEGAYDFAWLSGVLDKLASADTGVMLCTPTACPPAWLSAAHPEILRVNDLGLRVGHGARRHYCPNSPVYRAYAAKITECMVGALGKHPQVVAWQIDNELWEDCYCEHCEQAFRDWLAARFGSIGALNAAWNTALWSQNYQSFDQVPLPNSKRVSGEGHHPSLVRAYHHFMSDSYVSFCNEQAGLLRKHSPAPVTTNAHSAYFHKMEYDALFRNLDFAAHDCYAGPKNLARYAFESDWMRPIKPRPFWFTETSSTYSAGKSASDYLSFAHAPDALRAKLWLMYGLGAWAINFWLWRMHWAGQEQEHGALLYSWGEECVNTSEVRQVCRELTQYGEWLANTIPKPADVAMHYTVANQWILDFASIASGFRYDTAICAYHKLLFEMGIARDLISLSAPVDRYKAVCSPYAPAFEPSQIAKMQRFAESGGTWVLGPLSACRTPEGTAYQDAAYGAALEEWLGVHVRHRLPPSESLRLAGLAGESACQAWCDVYEPDENSAVLARYAGAPVDNMPAVVEAQIGTGRVILLGTVPSDPWLSSLLQSLLPAPAVVSSPSVAVMERVDSSGAYAGLIAVNTSVEYGWLHGPSGEEITLAPYGVHIAPV